MNKPLFIDSGNDSFTKKSRNTTITGHQIVQIVTIRMSKPRTAPATACHHRPSTRAPARVMKCFEGNEKMLTRVHERLEKRFGFRCGS